MMESDDNGRDDLVERFRADLSRPVGERFYSEDELITIFDLAGDSYDDYIRSEVLLLGMRLYPESDELMARRAIFYRDTDPNSFQSFLKDSSFEDHSMLFDIMRLSNLGKGNEEALEQVERFIENHPRLEEDEYVIQFVQALHGIGLDRWIVDNLEDLKSRVSYLPTLLYEIAILSDESKEFSEIAVKVLEELTELEPYTSEYWTLLSLVYSRQNRDEDALNAVEYALAIDPDNIEALKAKLRTLANKPDSPEIDTLLQRIGEADPDDADFAYIRLTRAEELNDIDLIHRLLESFTPAVMSSRPIFVKAIQYGYEGLEQWAEYLYENGITDISDWNELADYAFSCDNIEALSALIKVYEKKSGTALDHSFIDLRMLFRMHKYDVALALFTDNEVTGAIRSPENLMECYAIYVMSLLRTGYLKEAAEACDAMLGMIANEPMLPGSKIEKLGMQKFLEDIKKRLKSVRKTDWMKYDPIGLDRK